MIRDDLSDRLIHLTRGDSIEEASKSFLKINVFVLAKLPLPNYQLF
jgi:hypothetical protein